MGIMMIERFFPKIFVLAFLINCLIVAPIQAEVKVYIGVGEHYMEDENETLDAAKNKAKIAAELNALEQAQVNIQGYSESHNLNLTRDEIITITAGILNVNDVKYTLKTESDGIMLMTAIVTAEIDTDKIPELIEREIKHRANQK